MPFPAGAIDVTQSSSLAHVEQALRGAAKVAVDVEVDAMHHFRARLCFVQLASDEAIFLVDTLIPEVQVSELAGLFADPKVTKVFHAAQGDLAYLAEAGVRVQGLFDTHRAATLLGWPKVGLGDLVREHLGATLQKEHQQADFSLRPLPPELRAYIADDVRYLVELGRLVEQACRAADILEEVLLDCQRLCDEAIAHPDPAREFNIKLQRQGLSASQVRLCEHLARVLHLQRLAWAQAEDVPMGRMLSNMAIGAIAAQPPGSLRELARLKGVRGAFVRQHGEAVLQLVSQLRERERSEGLVSLEEKKVNDPRRKKREDVLLDWRKAEALERKVTPSVVLPNALVRSLAELAPRRLEELSAVPYLGPKRLDRYSAVLLRLLNSHL